MPLHPPPLRRLGPGAHLGVKEAEAALVEHYPRLVRLAYLTLPPGLGRHRRVLAAHTAVQRALRGRARPAPAPGAEGIPAPRSGSGVVDGTRTPAYAAVRLRAVRHALAYGRRPRWWPGRVPPPAALRPSLPVVRGLRLFPRAGGMDEFTLDRALADVPAPVRAALGLCLLESLSPDAARALLSEAGVADPGAAVRAAAQVSGSDHEQVRRMLGSGEFDPCTVQTRPGDLLRRRYRVRAGAAALALATLAGGFALTAGPDSGDAPSRAAARRVTVPGGALDPAALLRTSPAQWADTSRVDFSAWPPRGGRTGDRELLERALGSWAAPGPGTTVTATPGTAVVAPAQPPQLLFAGDVDGETVVLFHDGGVRVVRYAEPLSGTASPALDFARSDEADVTTAAALTVSRTATSARYLLAPWVTEPATRDLLAPDTPARPLETDGDGITAAVPLPAEGGACESWPAMQVRSSEKIVEKHAFLLTDLGELAPVHLTHTPAPGSGAPARQPREATSAEALTGWARTACSLRDLRRSGVRAVNNWRFAVQPLPGTRSTADWLCTRADTWRGPGRVMVQFAPPAASPSAPAEVVTDRRNTALCSRFGQHVVAGTHWRSPAGAWYVLAAGSRAVRRVEVAGAVRGAASGTTLAVRAPQDAVFRVTGELHDGGSAPSVR
ncbi:MULTISPECIES: hypothetical protein [unclassified Streptomyces]|uniref:hypothetical protein n=1 Tax=unclassified Streptomyces TaxID=2593676 RepID=UPI00093AB05F|nr:hypothetical protein [Streptomyces sp. CB02058]OKI89040.1 hypothetical protein AMK10_32750 [Streptomyces sp. CB02058]